MKIPYYVVVAGRGYWRPTKKMRDQGWSLVRCGPDGPDAWRVAASWNERWQRSRRGLAEPEAAPETITPETVEAGIRYPVGSIGEGFHRYRNTNAWKIEKKPRTREDWWRGWRYIRPLFADQDPRSVTLEQVDQWRTAIVEHHGVREAHRALKIWRALWKVLAALRYCDPLADPSLGIRNHEAEARSDRWHEGEVVRMVKTAWRHRYLGMACIIAVTWDSQLSPVDARSLLPSQLAKDARGRAFFTDRAKTGARVGGILSRRTTALVDAYLEEFGATMMPDVPLFRTRGSEPGPKGGRRHPPTPYQKSSAEDDFRDVRALTFGAAERRQLQDFRRSGAIEAVAGGATAEQLAPTMGNTLATSNKLFETYVPHDLSIAREVAAKRVVGRQRRRENEE